MVEVGFEFVLLSLVPSNNYNAKIDDCSLISSIYCWWQGVLKKQNKLRDGRKKINVALPRSE